jgi:hypothetical protein
MRRIPITNLRRNELSNWLIGGAPEPTWLGINPAPCVYVLFCTNTDPQDCCDGGNTFIIPGNGYSVKVGTNNSGPEKAILINYTAGPIRPCGNGNQVLPEVLAYIFIIDPGTMPINNLKRELKEQIQNLINQYFTPIPTSSNDWFPFRDGNGDQCDIHTFLDSVTLDQLNINIPGGMDLENE